jgi:hypothetical protein
MHFNLWVSELQFKRADFQEHRYVCSFMTALVDVGAIGMLCALSMAAGAMGLYTMVGP